MTPEEKQLLFKDLCERLPYGVMVSMRGGEFESYKYPYLLTAVIKFGLDCLCKVYHPIYTPFGVPKIEDVKPYLRPMSSMTNEEREEWYKQSRVDYDWLNAHHFDFRGLIEKGLALEAPEQMYKTE